MKQIIQIDAFKKEIAEFPPQTREDIFSLIYRYLIGERLNHTDFKTFKIDSCTKIQEFKVKDARGNWRAISCLHGSEYLVLVYAFHKKSQALQDKEKDTIRKRIARINL